MKTYYRILEDRNGKPATLFHGLNGSRTLPLDEWVEAVVKDVHDGSKQKAKKYRSGFHVIPTKKEADAFFDFSFRKKEDRYVVAVLVDEDAGIWDKSHSPSNVWLAKRMKITSRSWDKRKGQ